MSYIYIYITTQKCDAPGVGLVEAEDEQFDSGKHNLPLFMLWFSASLQPQMNRRKTDKSIKDLNETH